MKQLVCLIASRFCLSFQSFQKDSKGFWKCFINYLNYRILSTKEISITVWLDPYCYLLYWFVHVGTTGPWHFINLPKRMISLLAYWPLDSKIELNEWCFNIQKHCAYVITKSVSHVVADISENHRSTSLLQRQRLSLNSLLCFQDHRGCVQSQIMMTETQWFPLFTAWYVTLLIHLGSHVGTLIKQSKVMSMRIDRAQLTVCVTSVNVDGRWVYDSSPLCFRKMNSASLTPVKSVSQHV